MMADVGVSISGMPGPPLGPSYRITITAPCAQATGAACMGAGRQLLESKQHRWGCALHRILAEARNAMPPCSHAVTARPHTA